MQRIKVKVITNAKQSRILLEGDIYKIYVTAPAVEGRANKALIKILAEYFKVKKNSIRIIKGEKSKEKIVQID